MEQLGKDLGICKLYLKNDGMSGSLYGGNKIRKLEYLLADARQKNAKEILTFGATGSNHALATAVYAKKFNLACTCMLMSQPNADYVARNLKLGHVSSSRLRHYNSEKGMYIPLIGRMIQRFITTGKFPYIIWPGGSSPLGTIGYVNAGLELNDQIEKGLVPEPDKIYVTMGTMGTAVGLIIGLKVSGLKTHVKAIRVVEAHMGNAKKFKALFKKTVSLLRFCDPTFPDLTLEEKDVDINNDFFGEKYALFSKPGMAAVKLMQKTQDIKLEGTYTGKTLAALIQSTALQAFGNEVILFWNTYNAIDFSDKISGVNYKNLPIAFHRFFEKDVQPLDKINH
ncbi:MAG: pyridoxal-phosphate dependent enzyme [Desulfobacteraceae bacterium]|nr:pyridoxal-phosphate dependent enzyme [Desulfobacteraceae bacterium]